MFTLISLGCTSVCLWAGRFHGYDKDQDGEHAGQCQLSSDWRQCYQWTVLSGELQPLGGGATLPVYCVVWRVTTTGGSITSELCCLVSYNHWGGGQHYQCTVLSGELQPLGGGQGSITSELCCLVSYNHWGGQHYQCTVLSGELQPLRGSITSELCCLESYNHWGRGQHYQCTVLSGELQPRGGDSITSVLCCLESYNHWGRQHYKWTVLSGELQPLGAALPVNCVVWRVTTTGVGSITSVLCCLVSYNHWGQHYQWIELSGELQTLVSYSHGLWR